MAKQKRKYSLQHRPKRDEDIEANQCSRKARKSISLSVAPNIEMTEKAKRYVLALITKLLKESATIII